MPTFPIASAADFSEPVFLSESDERHLTKALRVRLSESVTLTNNQGLLAEATVCQLKPLRFQIVKTFAGEPPANITVCVPLIEKKRLELCLEKLTELNVKTVQLMVTERCQTRTLSDAALQKLILTTTEAQKQCGRATPLDIRKPIPVSSLVWPSSTTVFFGALQNTDTKTPILKPFDSAAVLIGPEGGFTVSENNFFLKSGYRPLNLGQVVLRAETACWVATALLKFCQV